MYTYTTCSAWDVKLNWQHMSILSDDL